MPDEANNAIESPDASPWRPGWERRAYPVGVPYDPVRVAAMNAAWKADHLPACRAATEAAKARRALVAAAFAKVQPYLSPEEADALRRAAQVSA